MSKDTPAPAKAGGYHAHGFWPAYARIAEAVDHRFGWDRLPKPFGLATIEGLRDTLRRRNLVDTSGDPASNVPPLAPRSPLVTGQRMEDGTYNDLDHPRTGMAGSRFGRNVGREHTWPEAKPGILEPSPREVSRRLMTRPAGKITEATGANALVAAWLQFMIRDWFSHGTSPKQDPWVVDIAAGDDWGTEQMTILRTAPDPTRPDGPGTTPPTFVNTLTHWWDASQIYGTTSDQMAFIRSHEGGRLSVLPDGSLPVAPEGDDPTQEPGFWVGLAMLRQLFTHEHNAIADMLAGRHRDWDDEQLFQHARLVLSALLAKIHTVEWTPSVIAHPTMETGMRTNWWGLAGERVSRLVGRLSSSEIISGIPGSPVADFGVPYALTEEFAAVYRMHPLLPDDYQIRRHLDGSAAARYTLQELSGPPARDVMNAHPTADLLYSFGTMHPGVCELFNYPSTLQHFDRPDGVRIDLAATDVMRHRELGVPRYCEFRRQIHLAAPRTFEELTPNPAWAAEIAAVYEGEIERVDLMVGMFAERLPKGFAFSDTAFRIFILMASRRLNSDRFFTTDFTPQVYTREGLRWVADNTMGTVVLRHFPELARSLDGVVNAFHPWNA